MNSEEELSKYDKYDEFYKNPQKYIPLDDLGDLYLGWFYDRYVALRMLKNMPIFERAYELLTERKHYSRNNAFGEMHCDGYLWILKHDTIKVIVEERQSYKYIYINDGNHFYIRALEYKYNYPPYRRKELKGITEAKFKKQGFKPHCPQDPNEERFDAFTYGDSRDDGHLLSMDYWLKGHEKAENSDGHSIAAIKSLEYWVYYLDDPNELE